MTDPAGQVAAAPHAYISTACLHGEHAACRYTCKYCNTPCACTDCDHTSVSDLPEPWVDQAREMARELLRYGLSTRAAVPPELLHRITDDPALFWLRGEVQPPGEWHGHPRGAITDLEWLTGAGFDVELGRRGESWRVSLQPAPDGWTAICGQGASIGEALAKARKWAEKRAS